MTTCYVMHSWRTSTNMRISSAAPWPCCMATLPVDTLRIDHTFKTAMNVGFARKKVVAGVEKREWVQQYSAVFFALDADSQPVGLQFCRNQRFAKLGAVSTVYTDQCCHDRNFLQRIFGPHVKAFLDTFHFKQRLRRALSTKHFGFGQAMMSFRKLSERYQSWASKRWVKI